MIVISANKKSLRYRIVILLVLWSFFFYFYRQLVREEGSFAEIINVIGIGLAALYYTPVVIITTLFRTIRVTITSDSLIVFGILTGSRTLSFPEIASFSTKSFQSANGRHERVTIVYRGNKRLKIVDLNVETILPVLDALRDHNILYTGHSEHQPPRLFKRPQQ